MHHNRHQKKGVHARTSYSLKCGTKTSRQHTATASPTIKVGSMRIEWYECKPIYELWINGNRYAIAARVRILNTNSIARHSVWRKICVAFEIRRNKNEKTTDTTTNDEIDEINKTFQEWQSHRQMLMEFTAHLFWPYLLVSPSKITWPIL